MMQFSPDSVSIPNGTERLFEWQSKETMTPFVTVIVPVFNYAHYVREALESIRAQTLANVDLIVIDDASTDVSLDVVTAWLKEHHERFCKASLLRQVRNSGLSVARNLGFQNARTEFVFPLDADNMIYPTCLEKMTNALSESRCAFAYCMVERFGTDPERVGFPLMHLRQWEPAALAHGNYIDAMALFRKEAWRIAGKYTEPHCFGWEDYEMWCKIARTNGSGLHIPQILARYRGHGSSMSFTLSDTSEVQKQLVSYFRENYPEFFAK